MKKFDYTILLFTVIFLEGYVVLSAELLAIRQTIPFVGSGTDTVSIIIAAVLIPLAFGYQSGGNFRPGLRNGRFRSIRNKLISNILTAMFFLTIGLSYGLLAMFFMMSTKFVTDHRLILVSVYCLLFLVTPVYFLGQTIPLASNYFSKEKLSQITGKILFFSTVGSFMGAVFSTIVLMSTIGVHHTVSLVIIILALLIFLLSKKKTSEQVMYGILMAVAALSLNSNDIMAVFNIVEDNQYNTIAVYEEDSGIRTLSLNNNSSSIFSDEGKKHAYIEFSERIAIDPIRTAMPPKDILVIGAGAFTFGFEDTINHYDFVDIDKSLKDIAEEHILKQKLSENKEFHPVPARAYLAKTDKKYDVILLDVYLGNLTIPEHLVTKEFFTEVKAHLKDNGILLANFITSPSFMTPFSRHIDNTFRSVFPHVSRQPIEIGYQLWTRGKDMPDNVIYIYRNHIDADATRIYTDNKNTIFFDKRQRR